MRLRLPFLLSLASFAIILNSCNKIDLSPDYSGIYKVSMVEEVYKNGKLIGQKESTGNLEVTHGTNQKTVKLHIFKDDKGMLIEMKIKLGLFSYNTTSQTGDCKVDEDIRGQFDGTLLECTYKGNQKCPNEEISIVDKIRGFKN